MLQLNNQNLFFFDFHCQLNAPDESPLFLAGMSALGFDGGLMVIPESWPAFTRAIKDCGSNFLAIPACEQMFEWGHVLSWGYQERLPRDRSDFRKVLQELKEKSRLTIFAHPLHPPTRPFLWDNGIFDTLVDEKAFDVVEIVNSKNYLRRGEKELYRWYKKRCTAGKLAISGGCDVHHLHATEKERENLVYRDNFPPEADIDSMHTQRTIVFADTLTEQAIGEAVLAGNCVVETAGTLVGAPDLVAWLKKEKYFEAAEEQKRQNRRCHLQARGNYISGSKSCIYSSESVQQINWCRKKTAVSKSVELLMPDIGNRPFSWEPISVSGGDMQRSFALKVKQPVLVDMWGIRSKDGTPGIRLSLENNTGDSLKLNVRFSSNILQKTVPVLLKNKQTLTIPCSTLPDRLPQLHPVRVDVLDGAKKLFRLEKKCTFPAAKYVKDFPVASAELFSKFSRELLLLNQKKQVLYGSWEGTDDLSAKLLILWNETGLCIYGDVTDPVHHNPFSKQDIWNGDSIQWGLDPGYTRQPSTSWMYEIVAALTDSGPQHFYSGTPEAYRDGESESPRGLCTGAKTVIHKKPKGLYYQLFFPAAGLAPQKFCSGASLGIYFLLFDNDGAGQKSILTWPEARRQWKCPAAWPCFTLIR
jgi:hypothetical protein